MKIRLLFLLGLTGPFLLAGSTVGVLSGNATELKFQVTTEALSADDVKPIHVLIGLPGDYYPRLTVRYEAKKPCPTDCSEIEADGTKWVQKQVLRGLNVGTLKLSPYAGNNEYYQRIIITVTFDTPPGRGLKKASQYQSRFLSDRILNWNVARDWFRIPAGKKIVESKPPSGNWIRFRVDKDGMYTISGAALIAVAPLTAERDPRSFMLFTGSNLGRDRTEDYLKRYASPGSKNLYEPVPPNLTEVSLLINGEDDGRLDSEDQLIFYGRGAAGFDNNGTSVEFHQNLYFTKNVYWLLIPDDETLRGKRVTPDRELVSNPTSLSYGIAYEHVETDLINPYKSGLMWVDSPISRGATRTVFVPLSSPNPAVEINLNGMLLGASSNSEVSRYPNHKITLHYQSYDGPELATLIWSGESKKNFSTQMPGSQISDGTNIFVFKNQSSNEYSQPFFDYLTLNYGRYLEFNGDPFEFYAPINGNPVKFSITATTTPTVWDITNPAAPIAKSLDVEGNYFVFSTNLPEDTTARFAVFSDSSIPPITDLAFRGPITFDHYRNQHQSATHLVLGPEEFAAAAQPFIKHRGSSLFIPLEQVYREFSGGNADPVAIRSFIQWTQENWPDPKPQYLLLLGDADYDYRNITGMSRIKVPTIEVGYSYSHATDDRLATIHGRIPEIAMGRYPARSPGEVESFVEKIIAFETDPQYGIWRQRITLVADDAARPEKKISELSTGKSHTRNSEIIARLIAPSVEVQKLYMMEFPEISDASFFGVVKPDATEALFDYLREGTAIINYIGHGSANQWAQERLLVQSRDLQSIDTGMKLPIWIAGTCSWGHFDDLENESFAEELIRQPMNGASAIITTSRPISVSSNQYYEEQIFKALFPNRSVTDKAVGDILQSTKTGDGSGELFHLFGDPAMPVTIPHNTVSITSLSPDTLRTLDTARFSGKQELSPAGGTGFIILKDANRSIRREYNYLSTVQYLSYTLPGATLFRGQFSFNNEMFTGKLRVPKDITYSEEPGRINVYLISNTDPVQEALGTLGPVYLTGGSPVPDKQGPIITFIADDGRVLQNGDHLRRDESLIIRLSDPLGINLTREVGHKIELTDLDLGQSKDVTNLFIYDPNSVTTGTIELELDENTTKINLSVKAWDNANNPSEAEIRLQQVGNTALKLFHVLNYPNPFQSATQFTFEITTPAEISVDIFTLGGRKIHSLGRRLYNTGYHTINWDGRDAFGDQIANGVYLYRLKASNDDQTVSTIGRLAKFR